MDTTWDCIGVGAGAAGLSAALVLGRARQQTLVDDAGGQRDGEVVGGERHDARLVLELTDGSREAARRVLLANGPAELDAQDDERLRAAGVAVDERPVAELRGLDGPLTAVAFADGGEGPCGGLLVPVTLYQRSPLAEQLSATFAGPGPVTADAVDVDARFHTNVPGLFAAGDASAQLPSVGNAIAAGHSAAAMIVGGLMAEAHGLAAAGAA